MNLKVEIRRNADGQTSCAIEEDFPFSRFWWEEGNASCDCNRELFFLRDRGEETETTIDEVRCGDGGYSVRISCADSGEVLYTEWSSDEI